MNICLYNKVHIVADRNTSLYIKKSVKFLT